MVLYLCKVALVFTLAIVAIRLMGKATLGQLTPHDLIAVVMIAALATKPILVDDFSSILLAIVLMLIIHLLYDKLTLYEWANRLILGEPTILIKHGKVIRDNLRKNQLSLVELLSAVRVKGYPDIRMVQYAMLEPTGNISVFPWEEYYPVTPSDLDMEVTYRGVALTLVADGRVQHRNLSLIDKDVDWLYAELRKQGFTNIRHVMYASIQDHEQTIYVDDGHGHNSDNDLQHRT